MLHPYRTRSPAAPACFADMFGDVRRFLAKFALALVLPAFIPAEPFPPLATVAYTTDAAKGG